MKGIRAKERGAGMVGEGEREMQVDGQSAVTLKELEGLRETGLNAAWFRVREGHDCGKGMA